MRGRRRLARLMSLEAATLAIASAVHLSGVSRNDDAGVAEALICVALLGGAWALLRSPRRGRAVALVATGFAILGFVVGLTSTVRNGAPGDLAYHATMLPVLIATLLALSRLDTVARRHGATCGPAAR
jgi:peptidoglycan/LPS O-acetylase OafA/YrhL